IAFIGYSHGATAGLYASQRRFQKAFGPSGAEYALLLLFYPYCNTRIIGDSEVTARPIRIFHGAADDWTPLAPCKAWIDRARAAASQDRRRRAVTKPLATSEARAAALRALGGP